MHEGHTAVGYTHGNVVYEREDGKFVLWNIRTEKFSSGEYRTLHDALQAGSRMPDESVDLDPYPGYSADEEELPAPTLWERLRSFFK
jgi:hypothetical protein